LRALREKERAGAQPEPAMPVVADR
jgi:hypothetical protein